MSDSPLMAIRPLEARDREAWQPLWEAYLGFYGTSVDAEVTETTWRRLLENSTSPFGFVAVDTGGGLAGLVHYIFHASTWTIGPYCYLQDLFVRHDARGGGIGRALIEAVYRAADGAGASQVYWLTQDYNVTARKLYDVVGSKTDFIKYRR